MKLLLGKGFERLIEVKIVESCRGNDGPDFSQLQKSPLPVVRHLPGGMHEHSSVRESDHRHAPAKADSEDLERILGDSKACVDSLEHGFPFQEGGAGSEPLQPPSDESSEATESAPAAMKLSKSSVCSMSFMERTSSSLAPVERNGRPADSARTVCR